MAASTGSETSVAVATGADSTGAMTAFDSTSGSVEVDASTGATASVAPSAGAAADSSVCGAGLKGNAYTLATGKGGKCSASTINTGTHLQSLSFRLLSFRSLLLLGLGLNMESMLEPVSKTITHHQLVNLTACVYV